MRMDHRPIPHNERNWGKGIKSKQGRVRRSTRARQNSGIKGGRHRSVRRNRHVLKDDEEDDGEQDGSAILDSDFEDFNNNNGSIDMGSMTKDEWDDEAQTDTSEEMEDGDLNYDEGSSDNWNPEGKRFQGSVGIDEEDSEDEQGVNERHHDDQEIEITDAEEQGEEQDEEEEEGDETQDYNDLMGGGVCSLTSQDEISDSLDGLDELLTENEEKGNEHIVVTEALLVKMYNAMVDAEGCMLQTADYFSNDGEEDNEFDEENDENQETDDEHSEEDHHEQGEETETESERIEQIEKRGESALDREKTLIAELLKEDEKEPEKHIEIIVPKKEVEKVEEPKVEEAPKLTVSEIKEVELQVQKEKQTGLYTIDLRNLQPSYENIDDYQEVAHSVLIRLQELLQMFPDNHEEAEFDPITDPDKMRKYFRDFEKLTVEWTIEKNEIYREVDFLVAVGDILEGEGSADAMLNFLGQYHRVEAIRNETEEPKCLQKELLINLKDEEFHENTSKFANASDHLLIAVEKLAKIIKPMEFMIAGKALKDLQNSEQVKDTASMLTDTQKSEIVVKNLPILVDIQMDAETLLTAIHINLDKIIKKKDEVEKIVDEMKQCADDHQESD